MKIFHLFNSIGGIREVIKKFLIPFGERMDPLILLLNLNLLPRFVPGIVKVISKEAFKHMLYRVIFNKNSKNITGKLRCFWKTNFDENVKTSWQTLQVHKIKDKYIKL